MKLPLSVYIIKHPKFSGGNNYARNIYSEIFRSIDNQTDIKSEIPVFFSESDSLKENMLFLDMKCSEKIAVILLVNGDMVLEPDIEWKKYIDELYRMSIEDINIRLFPIAMKKNVMNNFPGTISNLNFIRMFDISDEQKFSYLLMNIRHELCRMLLGLERATESDTATGRPVKLFLSHAKRDGLDIVTRIRNCINKDTGISDFFDTVDIEPGVDFLDEIESNISSSNLLIAFQSDFYSKSEWCKKEVLFAKEKDIPLLVVDCLKNGEVRSFPYIGNTKTICYEENDDNIEIKIISEALAIVLQKESYKQKIKQYARRKLLDPKCIKCNYPELISFNGYETETIIYPEPPIGKYEREILMGRYSKYKMLTPIMLFSSVYNPNIDGIKVAISISKGEDIGQKGITNYYCEALAVEMARYLIHSGAELLYGGDINYKSNYNFTCALIESLESYCKDYEMEKKLVNYVAGYIADNITEEQQLKYFNRVNFNLLKRTSIVSDGKYSTDEIRQINKANDLTFMRKVMTDDLDARIAVGGKKTGYSGRLPGVLEEIVYTLRANKPLYLIGAFGGVVEEIANCLLGCRNWFTDGCFLTTMKKITPKYLKESEFEFLTIQDEIMNLSFKDLNNGLSDDDNKVLLSSTNISEIVALVLKGLNNLYNKI